MFVMEAAKKEIIIKDITVDTDYYNTLALTMNLEGKVIGLKFER